MISAQRLRSVALVFALWGGSVGVSSSGATLIMAQRDADRVIVAADSREWGKESPVCKIHSHQGLFFVAGGQLTAPTLASQSVAEVCYDAAATSTTFAARVNLVEEGVRRFLSEILLGVKQSEKFTGAALDGVTVELLLFGLENEIPQLAYLGGFFSHRDPGHVRIITIRKLCPGDCQGGRAFQVIGPPGTVYPELAFAEDPWSGNPKRMFTNLGRIASERFPRLVAEPLDIIELTREGPRWVKRKGECPRLPRGR